MNPAAVLTARESEIAELIAWGASKKRVSSDLFIAERTVENHARSIYEKTDCHTVGELSAWWFCTHFNISFDLSPLKRAALALAMAVYIFCGEIWGDFECRLQSRTNARVVRTSGRRKESDILDDPTNFLNSCS